MDIKPINVSQLIEFLKTQPQHLLVAYQKHSEVCLLNTDDISVEVLQPPRPDGWVHSARPDKPTLEYLVFEGN